MLEITQIMRSRKCLFNFVDDVNTGGIVAGVIVALLAIALLCFGLWYANKKGYLPSKFFFLLFVCLCEI